MKITIIGGYTMRVGDGSDYWTLEKVLQAQGHQVTLCEALGYGMAKTEHSCKPEDVAAAEGIVAYSDGFATYKMIEHLLHGAEVAKKVVCGVAGVPDVWFQQYGGFGIWHLDADLGVMFNVEDIPTSYGLYAKDQIVQQASIEDFALDAAHSKYNVRCDGLFPALTSPSEKHKGVANHAAVLAAIVRCF